MKFGFIQGRLSPMINNRIQCFPKGFWEQEFPQAESLGFKAMEWTLDIDEIYENPLMTEQGQAQIKNLCKQHGVEIPSLTGDFLMQFPFYKQPENFQKGKKYSLMS